MKKFDLMNVLKKILQKDKTLEFQGAILAFKTAEDRGTVVISKDLGVKLRLIQEAQIQEIIMDKQMNKAANDTLSHNPKKLNLRGKTPGYFG